MIVGHHMLVSACRQRAALTRNEPMRDLRTAPPETLLSIHEVTAPRGPAPYRRTKFLELVARGEAPAPVMRAPRCVRWRWGDIQMWLERLAGDSPKSSADRG